MIRGKYIVLLVMLMLGGCVELPHGIHPVTHFALHRYLGKWYEIARLDHAFERGLSHVTADYSLRPDGGIRVINRGYIDEQQRWKQATGKAYFMQGPDTGFLKVSFFGPFYAAYIIFYIDQAHYHYALVAGPDKSYLWILSRRPVMDQKTLKRLVAIAHAAGFDTHELVYVNQS